MFPTGVKKSVPSKLLDAKLEDKATQKNRDATKIIPGGNNTGFKILYCLMSCIEIFPYLTSFLLFILMEQVHGVI